MEGKGDGANRTIVLHSSYGVGRQLVKYNTVDSNTFPPRCSCRFDVVYAQLAAVG